MASSVEGLSTIAERSKRVGLTKSDIKPARIFRFDEIREAHRVMEAHEAGGKMVVVH